MLRHFTSTITACAIAGVITVFGQEPAPSKPQAQQQPTPPSATLTGCVQEAKTTDGGKAFVLRDAEGGAAKMYVLIAQTSADLASHVSRKVEVVGQVQEPNPPPSPEGGASANPNVLRPPIVRVESVKTVAETCK